MVSFNDIQSRRDEVLSLAAKHGAHNVRVFGSVARGENKPSSDIDFLVVMSADSSLFDQAELLYDLEEMFGCKVDLIDEPLLYPQIREQILAESKPL
ncbi:MAG: nucleotidyltransferase [Planctomycetes bacterium GWF2_42_9]|nr:MAG: nucleotidyltransferase [Planctomycetes bacterium GWF2_42_9]